LTLIGEVAAFTGADLTDAVVLFSPNEVVELLVTTAFGLLRTLVAVGLIVAVADLVTGLVGFARDGAGVAFVVGVVSDDGLGLALLLLMLGFFCNGVLP